LLQQNRPMGTIRFAKGPARTEERLCRSRLRPHAGDVEGRTPSVEEGDEGRGPVCQRGAEGRSVIVILLSVLRLRDGVRVRVRNLQPSRREALFLPQGSRK